MFTYFIVGFLVNTVGSPASEISLTKNQGDKFMSMSTRRILAFILLISRTIQVVKNKPIKILLFMFGFFCCGVTS